VISIVLRPPVGLTDALSGEMENVHGAASSATPTSSSPTLIEPLRALGFWLAATVNRTEPSPCPDAVPSSWIHALAADALQAQSRFAEMFTLPLPPPAGNDAGAAAAVTAHFSAEGAVMFSVDELHARVEVATAANTAARRNHRISAPSRTRRNGSGRPRRSGVQEQFRSGPMEQNAT
jgi:hypothetical protein